MKYKWDTRLGVVDEEGRQVQQLTLTSTKKFRNMCGKLLVEKLNTIERGKLASNVRANEELGNAVGDVA